MEEEQYGSEYAKSNRAACKLCKNCIGMGALRLAIFVQSPFFDGKVPNWYHFACFFKKKIPTDTCFIKGFEGLRWDDQQKIKAKMGLIIPEKNEFKDENDENKLIDNDHSADAFQIDYAKSARSKCKKCDVRMSKNEIRVQIHSDGWYHLECFAKNKAELGFKYKVEDMTGYEELEETDQKTVIKTIGKPEEPKITKGAKRKIKNEPILPEIKQGPEVKKIKTVEQEKEQALRVQSEEYWKLKDNLNKELYKDHFIKEILTDNEQKITVQGRDNLIDMLCDLMYFGPLESCSECKNGQLIYKGKGYYCTGQFTEWTKCSHKTQEPARAKKVLVSAELKEEFLFLKKFKFKMRHRLFAKTLEEAEIKTEVKTETIREIQPLYKMNFSATPKLCMKNPEIKLIIERLGGKFTTSITNETVAVISNQDQLEKMGKKLTQSEELEIHVIDEQILHDLCNVARETIKPEELILKHNIATWGSDLKSRIELCIQTNEALVKNVSENKFKSKSGSDGIIKMKIKGGAVVDPDSGMEDEAHILCEPKSNDPYSCVLGLVDIERGTNSYYKLQVFEHDKYKSKWYVYRSWGRVGTTIGGDKLTDYNKKDHALEEFFEQYLDKTGNEWKDRKVSGKKPNRFYPLEMDFGEEEEENNEGTNLINDKNFVSKSELAPEIQGIIKLIFDIENMKRQMKEFEIDLNKMPLGKISSNQVKLAFNILNELTKLAETTKSHTMIVDASNRFYTLIPHDFGMKKPTILDDQRLIKEKTEMLNNLLEIEIAYNILKGDTKSEEDPIDLHFKKLKCDMEVLDHNTDEFSRLVEYVRQTHAETHDSYKLIVHDIIKINRESEEKGYKTFDSMKNRKLLWHGSRLTNYAGILSQGLRIAPPEAPCTGYMFGKGVYFADMVSKSANYCFTNKKNSTGLMLLCEVALGDMYELENSEYITKLPAGKNSTIGLGRTCPDPKEYFVDEHGVETPMGKGVSSGHDNSSLLYNEYIVYNTAQIRMKYLFKMEFDYQW